MKALNAKSRFKRILLYSVIILLLGLLYGTFVKHTGIAIPCVFYLLTGYKCPGCGITRMCMALIRLDISGAFWSHPMLFVQLPFLLLIVVRNMVTYVKYGICRLTRLENIVIYICIGLLVGFAVLRNIVGI